MKEADIVRSILDTLNTQPGVYCLRTHGSAFSVKGTPDILGCAKGRFFAIEVKKSANLHPSPAQEYILSKFRQALGKTFVTSHPKAPEVIAWINSL